MSEILKTQTSIKDGVVTHFRGQDVEPIIDKMAYIRNNLTKEDAHKKSMHLVGTIPAVIVEFFMKHGVNLFQSKDMQRYVISHPDLSKFRCYNGQTKRPNLSVAVKNRLDQLIRQWSANSGIG